MKIIHKQRADNSVLKLFTPGELLKLRDDALRHVKPRQWIFKRIEGNDTILLVDERGGFGWVAKIDNIDWEAYGTQRDKGPSHPI